MLEKSTWRDMAEAFYPEYRMKYRIAQKWTYMKINKIPTLAFVSQSLLYCQANQEETLNFGSRKLEISYGAVMLPLTKAVFILFIHDS